MATIWLQKSHGRFGKAVLDKQAEEGWGAKVIDRMSKDLKDAFSEMSGFSPRNIKYMRKLSDMESRIWYANKTVEHGWSSTILDLQI